MGGAAPYQEAFPVGTVVRIAPTEVLAEFPRPQYEYFAPLEPEQMDFAGQTAIVKQVGFYHGGDPLYVLEGLPGFWHEACLEAVPAVDA